MPYWDVVDRQGDVVAVTDQTGAVVDRYAYNQWGRETGNDGTDEDVPQQLRYRGLYYDEQPSWYWTADNRAYDPALERYLQPALGTRDYVFANDNPADVHNTVASFPMEQGGTTSSSGIQGGVPLVPAGFCNTNVAPTVIGCGNGGIDEGGNPNSGVHESPVESPQVRDVRWRDLARAGFKRGIENVRRFSGQNVYNAYARARATAQKWSGLDNVSNTVPHIQKLGPFRGRITGRMSSDGNQGWRIDFDPKGPQKGFHVN